MVADRGLRQLRAAYVPMASLPAGETVFWVVTRLRCSRCGEKAATVSLDNAETGWRRRVVKVWGQGSFG